MCHVISPIPQCLCFSTLLTTVVFLVKTNGLSPLFKSPCHFTVVALPSLKSGFLLQRIKYKVFPHLPGICDLDSMSLETPLLFSALQANRFLSVLQILQALKGIIFLIQDAVLLRWFPFT